MATSGNIEPSDTSAADTAPGAQSESPEASSAAGKKPKQRRRLYYIVSLVLIICLIPNFGLLWCFVLAVPTLLLIRKLPPYTAGSLFQPAPRSAQRSTRAGEIGWGTVLLIGAIVYQSNANRRDDPHAVPLRPVVRQQQTAPASGNARAQREQQQLIRREIATEQYWRTVVDGLFQARYFELFVEDVHQPADQFIARALPAYEDAVARAAETATPSCDAGLQEMMERHLEVDAMYLQAFREVLALGESLKNPPSSLPLHETQERGWQLLQLAVDDAESLPAEIQQLVIRVGELELMREENYLETFVMQARLQERYPGRTFQLPRLPGEDE